MDSFQTPETAAPRIRFERYCILNKEMYKKFRETYPDHPLDTWTKFKDFIYACNVEMTNLALTDRLGVDLPHGSGRILLKSYTPEETKVTDIGKSNTYKVRVYTKNYETDSKVCKITYTVYNKKFTPFSKKAWGFRATRDFKRLASAKFIENPNLYIHKVKKDAYKRSYKSTQSGAQTDSL
jgi:hypothetical protein